MTSTDATGPDSIGGAATGRESNSGATTGPDAIGGAATGRVREPGARPAITIAIDGVAGSGKSTAARNLAAHLGVDYLDTGAMYRSVAWAVLRRGLDPGDIEAVARLTPELNIDVSPQRVIVDGVDATTEIRGPEASKAVSAVAANPAVRAELVRRQRAWVAERGGGVVEGRDIATVVLPGADLKVFMIADPEARAERREAQGTLGDLKAAAADLARRDKVDSTRAASPLTQAPDATVVDTTHNTQQQTLAQLLALVAGVRPDLVPDANSTATAPSVTGSTSDPTSVEGD